MTPALQLATVAPSLARWLNGHTAQALVQRAMMDLFIMESPPGSNRGATIDSYNLACGVPEGSPYCASSLAAWARDSLYAIPPLPLDPYWKLHNLPEAYGPASTDAWWAWAFHESRERDEPEPGYALVYGRKNNPEHIALVIRTTPLLMTMEANTGLNGQYNREGVLFDRRTPDLKTADNILGFIDMAV